MGEYLHKDFHGALSCSFQYVKDKYGLEVLEEYWRRIALNCYGLLIAKLKSQGLQALEEHWRSIFELEGGDYKLYFQGDTLILEVNQCPGIFHLQSRGFPIAENFCEHTAFINKEICREAGFDALCTYEQARGRCRQEFRSIRN